MRTLVTGAAGFIGSHLVDRLLALGYEVVGVDNFDPFYAPQLKWDNLSRALTNRRFDFVPGDIRDAGLLQKVFSEKSIDGVIHLAAKAGVRPSLDDPAGYVDVNVRGTGVLLEAMRSAGVGRLVLASSSSVYGEREGLAGGFTEESALNQPVSPYAATKLAAEGLGYTYHAAYGMTVYALRYFTVYGPRQRPDLAIQKFMRCLATGDAPVVYGDGEASRDFTFVGDVVQATMSALSRVLTAGEPKYEVLNVGSDRPLSVNRLLKLIETAAGMPFRRQPVHLGEQVGDVRTTWANLWKAHAMLGYAPSMEMLDGLKMQWAWNLERAI